MGRSAEDLQEFISVFDESDGETLSHIATASRLIQYERAVSELQILIEDPSTAEKEFQNLLDANPWMFGSEYSELLPRRTWTRDDQLDYMLRRTADDCLEIIEIKTAFDTPLFIHDTSRGVFYPSAKLSPVIGQVTRYIEEVERNRDSILANDGYETLKIRAVAVIGRDGGLAQVKALRSLNSHLHRIEIITFDQLLRIATRVVSMFRDVVAEPKPQQPLADQVPF